MKTRRKLLIFGGILFLGWVLTGGIVVGSTSYMFAESDDKNPVPEIWLRLRGTDHHYGVPFLFMYFRRTPPCNLDVNYRTYDMQDDTDLVFEHVTVEFADGTTIDLSKHAKVKLQRDDYWYLDEKNMRQKKPCLTAKLEFHEGLNNGPPFVIRVVGRRTKGDQVIQLFDTRFKCWEHKTTSVTTTWLLQSYVVI